MRVPITSALRSHYVYVCPRTDGRLRLVLIHLYICCWFSDSTKGVSCYSCTDSSLINVSRIFLFETLYPDAAALGVSDPWTSDITDLGRSSFIMVTRIREWNWRVFLRPGLGDFNYKNSLKRMKCVGWVVLQ